MIFPWLVYRLLMAWKLLIILGSRYRLSARNIKKYALYFRTINLMEGVLYGKDQIKTGDQETKNNKTCPNCFGTQNSVLDLT